jgi:hypothetical protein
MSLHQTNFVPINAELRLQITRMCPKANFITSSCIIQLGKGSINVLPEANLTKLFTVVIYERL